MRTIQKLMGHKHISTTALYCEVSDDMLRSAVELVCNPAHARVNRLRLPH
jgi:site-specific recombinase XerD